MLCVSLDVTSRTSTEEAAALVEREFGVLDVLVINSGLLPPLALLGDSEPEAWWGTWEVNVKGPYLVSRAFLPLILRGGDKTIVTTASVGAHLVGPGVSAYQSSKLAVLRFMEFVSREYGDRGVVAFSIHPGNVPTDMIGGIGGVTEGMKHSESADG